MKRWIVFPILLFVCGCTTVRSTPLSRTESDTLYKDMERPQPQGVPITLKVPTHVDVYIMETYYLQDASKDDNYVDLVEVPMQRRNLWVQIKTIETEKVFTVDWKRPFSGTLDYSASMSDEQYFTQLGAKITDNTIKDVTSAFSSIVGKRTSAKGEVGADLIIDDRVVAFERFDIDACDFEQQVLTFVHHHLNACHDCEGPRLPVVSDQ